VGVLALGLQQRLSEDEVRVGVIAVADPVNGKPEDRGVEAVRDLRGDAQSLFRVVIWAGDARHHTTTLTQFPPVRAAAD
jgi:hypothetical protein